MTTDAGGARRIEDETEKELVTLFHTTMAEVAKGAIERSRDSAKYVQTAAVAVNTLYVGVLGLVFSVTEHPLPLRGIYAPVFLALAVALATAYLAFLTKPPMPEIWPSGASRADNQLARTGWLTKWVNASVLHRRYAIRASVLALGFGVLLVPAPFLTVNRPPEVPPVPAAPVIPAAVAPAVQADAVRLFEVQVDDFTHVMKAREEARTAAVAATDREAELNLAFGAVALLALGVVGLGPRWWERREARLGAPGRTTTGG